MYLTWSELETAAQTSRNATNVEFKGGSIVHFPVARKNLITSYLFIPNEIKENGRTMLTGQSVGSSGILYQYYSQEVKSTILHKHFNSPTWIFPPKLGFICCMRNLR